jgi:hypothetical protein
MKVLLPRTAIAAVVFPSCFALNATIWNPPIIPVPMSFDIWHIPIEVRVEGLADSDLPSTIKNLTVTGNEASYLSEDYNFWSPGSASEGNTLAFAGEANQQNIRVMSRDGVVRHDNRFAETGDFAIVFLNVVVNPTLQGPKQGVLPNSLTITGYLSNDAPFTVKETVLDPSSNVPTIGNPLKGTGWVASNGLDNIISAHRRAIMRISSSTHVMVQKFAIDWVQYGPDRTLYTGNGSRNEDWHCFESELYAVAPGTVVRVKSDLVDHPPFNLPPYELTLETALGNHVIIDIGGGAYAMYAHVRHSSPTVEVGDTVEKGQVVGLLGNTGSSDAPHLHLHISTCESGITCVDRPYVLEKYTSLNRLPNYPPFVVYTGPSEVMPVFSKRLPMNNEVLSFGNAAAATSGSGRSATRGSASSLLTFAVASLGFMM